MTKSQFISFSDENEATWPLIWSDSRRFGQVMAKIRLLARNDPIFLYKWPINRGQGQGGNGAPNQYGQENKMFLELIFTNIEEGI